MALVRLFGPARVAFGAPTCSRPAADLASLLRSLAAEGGPAFAAVLATSKVLVNGAACGAATALAEGDEVVVLPPVSGG